jgi:hypothetical protein
MTEYLPFGVRHALREADPEGSSELRRRLIPLLDGSSAVKGDWVDTDELALAGLATYRTLVLRRSPLQSRPPSPYRLVSSGRYYDVWQRPEPGVAIAEHIPLGGPFGPTSAAPCARLRDLAAAGEGTVAFSERPATVAVPGADLTVPGSWRRGPGSTFTPTGDGSASATVELPHAGSWQVWLGGSIRGRMELLIDGAEVGSVRHRLNNFGLFAELGTAELDGGAHTLELAYTGASVAHPGSGGTPEPLGPLIMVRSEAADAPLGTIDQADAAALCGRELDWVERLP